MSVATETDIEELLRPISAELPTGVDPRLDPSFTSDWRSLRSAREDARRTEREAANDGRSPFESRPIWRTACELAARILSSGAKDIEAACFLVEGWVRLDGFEGLRRGMTMLAGLVKQYGSDLLPVPQEGAEPSERMRPIERLCGPLAEMLILLPLTETGEQGAIATWQVRQAEESESNGRSSTVSLEAVRRTAGITRSEMVTLLLDQLEKSSLALSELDLSLIELCGAADAPATSPLRTAIEEIQRSLRTLYAARTAAVPPETSDRGPAELSGEPVDEAAATQGGVGNGPVRSRQEAFRQLRQVADFFEQMDPQCLLAAHIRRIVRLGNMSVTEYFSEIVEDKNARDQLFKLVGLTPPKESN